MSFEQYIEHVQSATGHFGPDFLTFSDQVTAMIEAELAVKQGDRIYYLPLCHDSFGEGDG